MLFDRQNIMMLYHYYIGQISWSTVIFQSKKTTHLMIQAIQADDRDWFSSLIGSKGKKICDYWLEDDDKSVMAVLHYAVKHNAYHCVEVMLNTKRVWKDAMNIEIALTNVVKDNNIDMLHLFLAKAGKDWIGVTCQRAFFKAVETGHVNQINAFIDYGLDFSVEDAFSQSALAIAIKQGHTSVLSALLSADETLHYFSQDQMEQALTLASQQQHTILSMWLTNHLEKHKAHVSQASDHKHLSQKKVYAPDEDGHTFEMVVIWLTWSWRLLPFGCGSYFYLFKTSGNEHVFLMYDK